MKLKITALPDEKPIKLTIEFPAAVHRDLKVYAEIVAGESGQVSGNLEALVVAMVARFMATDRAFLGCKRKHVS
ncbi:DUF2274 domain-containing protein [Bradyrhizobium sp. HKCCYLS20291]|uniref:DUF2274 domain-containing protein n=1 Tax=Bradyrhizobium sp. HKCCYLS20291 TaxID=3420766 RepID=UPI003EBE7EF2